MRALVFGTYDTSMHPRVCAIAEGLRASGAQVSECNAPLGLDTAARVDLLARPWRAPALAVRLAGRWLTLARAARRMPAPDVVVVGYLGHFDVHLARLLFRRVPIVLDHLVGASDTGRDRRLDAGPRQAILRLIDAAALRAADVIVVDTDEHLAALPARHQPRAVVVPVGAPANWFAAAKPAESDAEGPLRVVFYGLYTPLQGTPVIGAALGKIAGAPVHVTMIGNGQDIAEARSAAAPNPGVKWIDWVPARELPAVVAAHHVCLGIFGTGEKALRVVPNKVFQGAAAGCAIVTSDTAPQRRAFGAAAVLVPPGDPEALAAALLRLADDRQELARLRAAARRLAADTFAPAQIVAPLLRALRPAGQSPPSRAHDADPGAPAVAPAGGRGVDEVAPLAPNAWLRYDVVQRLLPAGARDVLEVGCGRGAFGARLAQRYNYLGVEPDHESWAVASERMAATGRGDVRNVSSEDLAGQQFDLVCAFEVLEHIEDDQSALRQWAGLLRPGGWLLLSVPAHQRRFGAWDELVGHYRRYDPPAIARLLASCGFTDVTIRLYGFPLGYLLEPARNLVGRRRLAAGGEHTMAERTTGSGRQLQPTGRALGTAIHWATVPFRLLQRAVPEAGTGLVVRARLADPPRSAG
ncbi:MAG TPA: methyltransferase domain-containing protein [Streptosporangiaceae bacterium]|nr:methyltransferase domain-containing protein [Streptosporangiaceae bacterium]